jgi:hypothetical protein
VPAPRATGTTRTESDRQRSAAKRDGLYQLRDVAAALAQGESRVCVCGRKVAPGLVGVEVKRAESGRAYFAGTVSCGSVWTCPPCAAKIARGRQTDVGALLEAHQRAGGAGLFLTLTVPHDQGAPLRELRRIVARAWQGIQSGAQWLATKERCGIVGTVRALEVTHGRNGWHPHLHVLILCAGPLPDDAVEALHAGIVARWARAVVRGGLRAPQGERCPLSRIYSHDAADYLAKISAVLELTRWDAKQGRESGRSPFQILAGAGVGSARDVALWREWCDGIKGARQLTWSTGLRARYQLGEEATDAALATAEVGGETVVILSRPAWKHVCRVPMLRADVLRAAERGGAADVLELLDSLPHWPADAAVTVLTRAGPLPHAA